MNKIFLLLGGLCVLLAVQAAFEPKNLQASANAGKVGTYSGVSRFVAAAFKKEDDRAAENSDYDEEDYEEKDEEHETEPLPDLNCILFEDSGCGAYCSSLSLLYGKVALGQCSKYQTCECKIQRKKPPTLRSLWNETFLPNTISRKILKTIENDPELAAEVRGTLEQFPRTRKDILGELYNVVLQEVEGIEQLKIRKGRVPVQDYMDKNGNVDFEKLGREFTPMLRRSLEVVNFPVKNMDYVKNLQKFLEISDDEEKKRYIEDSVNKTNNFDLKKLINSNNLPYVFGNTNGELSYITVPEYVAAIVTNELIGHSKQFSKQNL